MTQGHKDLVNKYSREEVELELILDALLAEVGKLAMAETHKILVTSILGVSESSPEAVQ